MDMAPTEIKKLRDIAKQRRRNAAAMILVEADFKQVQSELDYAAAVENLLPPEKNDRRPLRISLIFALICLMTASFVWAVPVWWRMPLSVEVKTNSVRMTLAEEWRQPGLSFSPTSVFINNVITFDDLGLMPKSQSPFQGKSVALSVRDGRMTMNGMDLAAGAEVEADLKNNRVNFHIKNSALGSELVIEKGRFAIEIDEDKIEKQIDQNMPELVEFRTNVGIGDPVRLALTFGKNPEWLLHGLNVSRLDFLEEFPPDSGRFESAVLSGKVRLPEMEQEEKIYRSDRVIFSNLETRRLEISPDKKGFRVFLEGRVSDIRVGPKGFEKNLTPSVLEYLYHQQKLALFWGAIVFVWGLLWGGRDLLRRK